MKNFPISYGNVVRNPLVLDSKAFQPETILIDEPELGLHPFAIHLLASMLCSTSKKRQIIVSTQSTDLLNEFEADDVIVADRAEGWTDLHRLDAESLATYFAITLSVLLCIMVVIEAYVEQLAKVLDHCLSDVTGLNITATPLVDSGWSDSFRGGKT